MRLAGLLSKRDDLTKAAIDLDAKGQKVIGNAGASPKDLQHIVATTGFGVGAIRVVRIASFGDRFLKK